VCRSRGILPHCFILPRAFGVILLRTCLFTYMDFWRHRARGQDNSGTNPPDLAFGGCSRIARPTCPAMRGGAFCKTDQTPPVVGQIAEMLHNFEILIFRFRRTFQRAHASIRISAVRGQSPIESLPSSLGRITQGSALTALLLREKKVIQMLSIRGAAARANVGQLGRKSVSR